MFTFQTLKRSQNPLTNHIFSILAPIQANQAEDGQHQITDLLVQIVPPIYRFRNHEIQNSLRIATTKHESTIKTCKPDIYVKDGLNLTQRVGDTGANAPYVALGLGILAMQKEGGVSAVVCLRRDDRATITMVSPPTDEDRAKSGKPVTIQISQRLPLGMERPSNSRCPEPGLWQCAHAEHADGRLRHFSQDEWFPEALLLHRRLLWHKEELLDTTWTLIAYPDPPSQDA